IGELDPVVNRGPLFLSAIAGGEIPVTQVVNQGGAASTPFARLGVGFSQGSVVADCASAEVFAQAEGVVEHFFQGDDLRVPVGLAQNLGEQIVGISALGRLQGKPACAATSCQVVAQTLESL